MSPISATRVEQPVRHHRDRTSDPAGTATVGTPGARAPGLTMLVHDAGNTAISLVGVAGCFPAVSGGETVELYVGHVLRSVLTACLGYTTVRRRDVNDSGAPVASATAARAGHAGPVDVRPSRGAILSVDCRCPR